MSAATLGLFALQESTLLRLWFEELPPPGRVAVVIATALAAHFLVQAVRKGGEWIAMPGEAPSGARQRLLAGQPKAATLVSLVVSGLTFTIYFLALGFAVRELTPITLTQYFASATVIGLAVGFGTQGLVQDVVTGLTLIFSNAVIIGQLVDVSGHMGRVERIGLRFTTLTNFVGQTVVIPNRNIGVIGSYRTGYARAYLDVQIPGSVDEAAVIETVGAIARGARDQFASIIVGEPRIHAVQSTQEGGWRYLRTRFRIWPGQHAIIENAVRQRVIAAMKELDPAFVDWMATVTYRIR